MTLKVSNAIICDLVRTEDTGKNILIGVYGGGIAFDKFPSLFAPVFWIQLQTAQPDEEMDLEIKVEGPITSKLGTAELRARSGADRVAIIVLGGAPIQIAQAGRLTLSMRRKGERWSSILSKDIALRPSTPPAA